MVAAAQLGLVDIVECLIDGGADINAIGGEYKTALGAAVSVSDAEMTRALLERGADVQLLDDEQRELCSVLTNMKSCQ